MNGVRLHTISVLVEDRPGVLTRVAGLFAARDGAFHIVPWLVLAFGLTMAHASNNLLNDHIDYVRGVDQGTFSSLRDGEPDFKLWVCLRSLS